MKKLTREWTRKAERDWEETEVVPDRVRHDAICYHAQQSAEKYLKALLQESGDPIPRTHNLEDLLGLLAGSHPTLVRLRRGLRFLTRFAVEIRYPGLSATRRQAEAARRWAGRIRHACRDLLGIKPKAP